MSQATDSLLRAAHQLRASCTGGFVDASLGDRASARQDLGFARSVIEARDEVSV